MTEARDRGDRRALVPLVVLKYGSNVATVTNQGSDLRLTRCLIAPPPSMDVVICTAGRMYTTICTCATGACRITNVA